MSQKRMQLEDADALTEPDDGSTSDDKRRKTPSFQSPNLEVSEVMELRNLQQRIEQAMEPLIRKVVKEEVDLAMRKHFKSVKRNCEEEMQCSNSRSLQLRFTDTIALPVFTGSRIQGDECTTMKIALIDDISGEVISTGPISSAKVEIVVLEGDFDGSERENWTFEEFKSNLVRERQGKKALLTGDAFLNLEKGIGLLGEIYFTDNSSWTRSRRFRLGARVVDNYDGIRVREAKTESFVVRDHRGELYKKHHPPCLLDEVWRLEKIGKEGAFHKRLSKENVETVKDFLTLCYLDPVKLRNILGSGMSAKMLEVTVEHARTCVLDKRVYLYRPRSQQYSSVVFNIVGQLKGLLSDCQYVSVDKLSETEKAEAHILVMSAFKQWEEVLAFDDETSLVDGSSLPSNICHLANSPSMAESSDSLNILSSDRVNFDFSQLDASTPDIIPSIYPIGGSSMDEYGLHTIVSIDDRFDQTQIFPNQAASSLTCDPDSITPSLPEDDHLQYFRSSFLASRGDQASAVDGFLYAHTIAIKAHRRWTLLFSVLKWISISRIVKSRSKCSTQKC